MNGCNTGKRKAVRSFEGKRNTGRPRSRYLGNIRTDLIKIRKSMLIRFNILKWMNWQTLAHLGVLKAGVSPILATAIFKNDSAL
jgi:hypothetical protein